jgi:hypothetical protein
VFGMVARNVAFVHVTPLSCEYLLLHEKNKNKKKQRKKKKRKEKKEKRKKGKKYVK